MKVFRDKLGSKVSGFAVAAALVGMMTTEALAQSDAGAPIATVQPSQPWAQVGSDVPADPSVRYGTLPNGMRYAIMHNDKPKGKASLRLRIEAGSLYEKDNQLGLAHFMEHMAFNGTTHIPKNDLIKRLERMGLSFGADLNAATGFDQTFYSLDIPKTDANTVDTALFMMREQVSEAVMDPKDIDGERGVIRGEERLRNSPSSRAGEKAMAIYAPGQIVSKRFPIGDLKIIDTAPRSAFIDFYHHYYRPSRATMIAIGDFNVDQMEAQIRKHFADWQPKGPDGAEPDLGTVQTRGEENHVIVEPGTQRDISLAWIAPFDPRPDTYTLRRENYIVGLAIAALNQRLVDLTQAKDAPFAGAGASRQNLLRSLNMTTVNATVLGDKWQVALKAIDQETRRIAEYGISDSELQRLVNNTRPSLEQSVKTKGSRSSGGLAMSMIQLVNDRNIFASPEYNLQSFNQMTKGLTAADVNKVLKSLFSGNGPIVMYRTPEPIDGGDITLAAAYHASKEVAVAAPLATPDKGWAYTDFGAPGTVVSREELPEVGATKVTFKNGVTLLFKQTSMDKNTVIVQVDFGVGNMNFSPNEQYLLPVAMSTLTQSGLGKLNDLEIGKALTGRQTGATFSINDRNFVLSGTTRTEDLTPQMQVLAAYMTDPAFDPEPFDAIKKSYAPLLEALNSTPEGVYGQVFEPLLAGGDQRKQQPGLAELTAFSLDAHRSEIRELFRKGPLNVIVLGDTTLEEAIATTAATFGAMPDRLPVGPPVAGADQRRFPAPTREIVTSTHTGLAEQALGVVAWPAPDALDPQKALTLSLLNKVLRLRVLDEIRERLAIAYSPRVGMQQSDVYQGYGFIDVQAATAPDKLPAFFAAVDRIAASLRDKPVGKVELERARNPVLATMRTIRDNNSYWALMLDTITWSRSYASAVEKIGHPEAVLKITPAEIQAAAREYLVPGKAWRGQIIPADLSKKAGGTKNP